MAKLRLSGTEFAKQLGNGARFEATWTKRRRVSARMPSESDSSVCLPFSSSSRAFEPVLRVMRSFLLIITSAAYHTPTHTHMSLAMQTRLDRRFLSLSLYRCEPDVDHLTRDLQHFLGFNFADAFDRSQLLLCRHRHLVQASPVKTPSFFPSSKID